MSHDIEFVEAETPAVCPFCEIPLKRIEYTRQKLAFDSSSGFTWVVLLMCPGCHKVLGTQTWD